MRDLLNLEKVVFYRENAGRGEEGGTKHSLVVKCSPNPRGAIGSLKRTSHWRDTIKMSQEPGHVFITHSGIAKQSCQSSCDNV